MRCLLLMQKSVLEELARVLPPGPVDGVTFVPYREETNIPPSEYDVVISRAMYDAAMASADAGADVRWALLQSLPPERVLDSTPDLLAFGDREKTMLQLTRVAPAVHQPRSVTVRWEGADVAACVRAAGLRFPLIAKPLLACGPGHSHELTVALHPAALREICPPTILQEYVNHGGTLFKAYALGPHAMVQERASLPDLQAVTDEEEGERNGLVRFNSQQPPPSPAAFGVAALEAAPPCEGEREQRRAVAAELVKRLAASWDLLGPVGIDVVFSHDGTGYVVDANYFPKTAGKMEGVAEALASAVRTRVMRASAAVPVRRSDTQCLGPRYSEPQSESETVVE